MVSRALLGKFADGLGRFGLATFTFRIYERLLSFRSKGAASLPPAYLRVLTSGSEDPAAFVALGERAADDIVDLARAAGTPVRANASVLEFGCGCGRVARPFMARTGVQIHGCDVNPQMAQWCRKNLGGTYIRNDEQPPLPYENGVYDLVYALSVFTHLSRPAAKNWLSEMGRVTRPGGLGVFSFLDAVSAPSDAFREELEKNGFVTKRKGPLGSNLLTVFFSPDGLAECASDKWRLINWRPSIPGEGRQAYAVFERRS